MIGLRSYRPHEMEKHAPVRKQCRVTSLLRSALWGGLLALAWTSAQPAWGAGTVTVNSSPTGARIWYKYNGAASWVDSGQNTNFSFAGLPEGTYQIRLIKSGYALWDSNVETLSTGGTLLFNPTLTPTGTVAVNSSPAGAQIWFKYNSSPTWNNSGYATNYSTNTAPIGTYQIQLVKTGYVTWVSDVQTLTAGGTLTFNPTLSPSADVSINSSPDGAEIWYIYNDSTSDFVKSDFKTNTTFKDALPAGKYRIKLAKPDYTDFLQDIVLNTGANTPVNATLVKSANLTLTSTPTGAHVYYMFKTGGDVAWNDSGFDTPHTFSGIPAGTYQIKLVKSGYPDWTSDVTLTPGESKTTHGNFLAPANISVNSTPSGAEIWASLDGKVWSNSGQKTNFDFTELSTGTYYVKLIKPGYAVWNVTRTLVAGTNTPINATLTPSSAPMPSFVVWDGQIKVGGVWFKSELHLLQSKPGIRTAIDKTLALVIHPTTPNGTAFLEITGGRNGSTDYSFMDPQFEIFLDNKRLLDKGWTLISAEYRGSLNPPDSSFFNPPLPKYGDLIPQYDTFDGAEWGHGEEDDVVAMGQWVLGGGAGIVPNKAHAIGLSHGSYLATSLAHRVSGFTRIILAHGGADGVGFANYQKDAPTAQHPDFPGASPVTQMSQTDRTNWIQRIYPQAGGETEWNTVSPGRKWFDAPPKSPNILVLSNVDDWIAPGYLQTDYAERWSPSYPGVQLYQYTAKEGGCSYSNTHGCVAVSLSALEDYLINGTLPSSYKGAVLADAKGQLIDQMSGAPVWGATVTYFNRYSGITRSERTGVSGTDGKVTINNIHGGYLTIQIKAPGYETLEGDVYLHRGMNDFTSTPTPLVPLPKGSITVNSSPTGARVWYSWNGGDWSDTGLLTNRTFNDVPAGSYRVKLMKPGYDEWISSPQTLVGGNTVTINATLSLISLPQIQYYGIYQNVDNKPANFSELNALPWVNIIGVGEKDAGAKLTEAASKGKKAIVAPQPVFFGLNATPDPGRTFPLNPDYILLPDYEARWNAFVKDNNLKAHVNDIAAFYLADEPYWNNLTYEELRLASVLVKRDFPTTPIAIVEAYAVMDHMNGSDLRVPEMVDWVGFDKYGVPHPATDNAIGTNLATLKSKLTQPRQRIIFVGDAWFEPSVHGANGLKLEDMPFVFNEQVALAKKEPRVVAFISFTWDSYGDDYGDTWTTAREFPPDILEGYKTVGQRVLANTPGDRTAPTGTITSPSDGAIVGKDTAVTLTAGASDNVAVAGVEFYMDGQFLGTDTSAPYQWTETPPLGVHQLEALVYDAAGNSRLSTPIFINVTDMAGTLIVKSSPSGAHISYTFNGGSWIDTPFDTDHTFLNTTAGSYRVRLVKSGYTSWEQTQILTPGATLTFDATLVASPGTLLVKSTPPGARIFYSFNGGAWVDSSFLTNHTFADMPAGSYRVRLEKTGYTDWEQTQTLTPGGSLTFDAALADTPGTLIVNSDPTGARVFTSYNGGAWVDSTFDTNHIFSNVAPGTYKIRLVKDGYEAWENTHTVSNGETVTVNAVLSNLPGTLIVTSSPGGARIFTSYNYGPWTDSTFDTDHTFSNRPPGHYQVRLTKTGYADWENSQTLLAGGTLTFNATLSTSYGTLVVNSSPTGARVFTSYNSGPWIDSTFDTDHTFTSMPPGDYRVRLVKSGYVDWEGAETLAAGETRTFNATLTSSPGTITVQSTPTGAHILTSYNSGPSVDSTFDTDHTFSAMAAGTYRVRLVKDGYSTWEQTQILPTGGVLTFNATLSSSVGTIAVQSTPPGARIFTSYNSGPWVDSTFDTNHTFSDMPAGVYRVRLVKTGVSDWESVQVLPSGGSIVFDAVLASDLGSITVHSIPSGAHIFTSYNSGPWVDSTFDTDHTFSAMAAGTYRVRLVKDGYSTWEQTQILPTGGVLTFNATLSSSVGTIAVQSTPPGARIFTSYNSGPWVDTSLETDHVFTDQPAGVYRVRLVREGYASWEQTQILTAGGTVTFEATLSSTLGTFTIHSEPIGAKISYTYNGGAWIDTGKFTNDTFTNLPLGTYVIKLEKDGYAEWIGSYSLSDGQTIDIQTTLRPSLIQGLSGMPYRIDAKEGGTAGDLRNEGVSVTVLPDSLSTAHTLNVSIDDHITSTNEHLTLVPPTYQGIQAKLPMGKTLHTLFEVAPQTSADMFSLPGVTQLDRPLGIVLARESGSSDIPSLWRWDDASAGWRQVPDLEPDPSGTQFKTTDNRLGLYAILLSPAAQNPQDVAFFPQPALGPDVTLRIVGSLEDSVHLSLFDPLGQRVMNRSLKTSTVLVMGETAQEVRIDVSDLSSGVYQYVVEGAGWKTRGKMAVVR